MRKRLLSGVLAVITAVSMCPMTSHAEEAGSFGEEIMLEEEVEAPKEDELTEDVELTEDAEAPEDIEDIEAADEELTAHSEEGPSEAGPSEVTEYYVAPGFEGTYTVEEVKEYFENEYDLYAGTDEDSEEEAEFLASAEDIKKVMKRRASSYKYTDSSFNAKSLIEGAMVDSNETDPTGGDYIKGNLIAYSASGSGNSSGWTIEIKFMWAAYGDAASEEAAVTEKVKEIKAELNLTSSALSDYEKVCAIDDYMQKNIKYPNPYDGAYGAHGTYAALVNGVAVCQGYSTAFLRLAREAGIPAKYITSKEINHAWNIVKVEGGTDPERPWYNIDTTWGRFLENDVQFMDHPRDKEYRTDNYKKKHPISLYNWGLTTAGLNMPNKEFIFNSVDGSVMTSTVDTETKTPKIIVLYYYGESNQSAYPAQLFKSLESHKILKSKKIEVYAVDVHNDVDSVKKYMKDNGLGSEIKFAGWNQGSNDAGDYYGVDYSPFVVMIDENNVVQFANAYTSDYITKNFAAYVWDTFMYYLVEDWDHTAVLKSITLDKATMSLTNGESDTLEVSYNPTKTCDDKTVTWTSSDETVATVTSTGMNTATVTATGSGVATITAKCMSKTATCRVTTFTPITGVTLEPERTSTFEGEKIRISAVVSPKKGDVIGGYSWEISDPTVAAITVSDNGDYVTLTGKKAGDTTVTVTADGKTASQAISVISSNVALDYQGGSAAEGDPLVITGVYGAALGELPVPTYEGHVFLGWYTGKDCTGTKVSDSTRITRYELGESFVLYAGYKEAPEGAMTILPVADQMYTGAALKPAVIVYYGDVKLTAGKDYTVKYTNNKNAYALASTDAGFTEKSSPTATVTGKGNFAGTAAAPFRILPKNLADNDVTVNSSALYLTANGKAQKSTPAVKYGKTALKAGKDYDYSYPDSDDGDYVKAGQNRVVITAKEGGNYTGTRTLIQTIARGDLINISKCKVTIGKSYEYTGSAITPEVTVKSGNTTLTEGRDYKLILSDNIEVGTASVIVSGIGGFTGVKKGGFKITGVSIAKADVTLNEAVHTYNGAAHEPAVAVKLKKTDATSLVEGTDYTISYASNVNKGKASVIITGCGKYTGVAKKTFTIAAAKLDVADVTFANGDAVGLESYVKGGSTPVVTVVSNGRTLKAGTDYTLKYSGNNQIYEYKGEDKKAPTATITGKGNYAGTKKAYFSIVPSKLQDRLDEGAYALAGDVVYSSKAGKWKSAVTVFDSNGKKLVAGTDYLKDIKYTYKETGLEIAATDAASLVEGTEITATITGTKAYEGTVLTADYHIISSDKNIAKGITFKAADKEYTGKPVVLSKSDITFEAKGKADFTESSFEIVEGSYVANTVKGTAKVTIKGVYPYGGTKTISFKILPKPVN